MIGILVVCVEHGLWIRHALGDLNAVARHAEFDPELRSTVADSFTRLLLEKATELTIAAIVGWWIAYPVFSGICVAVRRWIFPRVPEYEWRSASDQALWPLPYAAVGGVITWFAYYYALPYGWTNDIACGLVAHILGAWCYLTVFVAWFKVVRSSPPQTDS
jgi:hypothetical protein